MTPPPAPGAGPESVARVQIDAALVAAGWVVQDRDEMNVCAAVGVAVREFRLKHGHGFADYLLFVISARGRSSRSDSSSLVIARTWLG